MRIISFILIVLLFASCNQSMDYASQNLSAGWSYSDRVTFSLEEQDSGASALNIIVDHSIDYGYENLYLVVSTTGQISTSDTISIQLADARGSWLSSCRSDHCLLSYPYVLNETQAEVTEVSISQYSREQVLKGINQIGVEL